MILILIAILLMVRLMAINYIMAENHMKNPGIPLWIPKLNYIMVGWCLANIITWLSI